MTKHYFAADGSYGDAQIIVVDTSDWSKDEWDIIENCSDSERLDIAYQLTMEQHQVKYSRQPSFQKMPHTLALTNGIADTSKQQTKKKQ